MVAEKHGNEIDLYATSIYLGEEGEFANIVFQADGKQEHQYVLFQLAKTPSEQDISPCPPSVV